MGRFQVLKNEEPVHESRFQVLGETYNESGTTHPFFVVLTIYQKSPKFLMSDAKTK